MDVAAALWSAGGGGIGTTPHGWGLPPADAFGFGVPSGLGPVLAWGASPGAWGGCGCGRPGCPGCPSSCALAAPHDYLREVAALAAAAAALGLPIPSQPQPLAPQPQMAFMPVAEAGGRSSKEDNADVARVEGEDSDCKVSTDSSEEGLAAGSTAARLPPRHSTVAVAATVAMEEAAAAAAMAVRSLDGSQDLVSLGCSNGAMRRSIQPADQLPGGLDFEEPVTVSDLFNPSDSWLHATPSKLTCPPRGARSVEHGAAAASPGLRAPPSSSCAEPAKQAPLLTASAAAPHPRPPAPGPPCSAAQPAPSSITGLLQSIPQTNQGSTFCLGAPFMPEDPLSLPQWRPANRWTPQLASSGLNAAGGLTQAMEALQGACMGEMPFSMPVTLEGRHAADAGGEAERVVQAGTGEATAADVAAALEALGCGPSQSAQRLGGAAGHREQLMPPPPPRQVGLWLLQSAGLSREQLAAAVLAATEADNLPAANWGTSGADKEMQAGFAGLGHQALPPEPPSGWPAEPSCGARRSCRLAAVHAAAAPAGLAAGRTAQLQMRQVDGAADSPTSSLAPRCRARSRKRCSEPSVGLAPSAEFGSLLECDGAEGSGSGTNGEAEPFSAPASAGGLNRTWSGLFVGSGTPPASAGPSTSSGARQRQAHQAQQLQPAVPARQPRGLAGLLSQSAAATAGGSLLPGLAGAAASGHRPPHLMKTSQFRGVSWCKRRSLWEAAISINGKRERLGFYHAEEDAARAYDMLACWRNRQLATEHAERQALGTASCSRRRRGGSGGTARRGQQVRSTEDEDETESEKEGEPRPAKRRLLSQQLPLNLPEDAPDGSAPILSGSLEDVLECVREAAKQRIKEEPSDIQPSQPATQQPQEKRLRLGSEDGDASVPSSSPSMLAYSKLLDAATDNAAAAAVAAAAAAHAFAGALDPNADPGLLAAAAAQEAAHAGATVDEADAAACSAAAVALRHVPLVKSSKYQGVCLCGGNQRWQAQVTYKRKRHYLGMHSSQDSAAKAYDQGAIALLGTSAQTNFPLACYNVQALMREGIQAVAARLKARGKAEAAAAERPCSDRRCAGATAEDAQEDAATMEE